MMTQLRGRAWTTFGMGPCDGIAGCPCGVGADGQAIWPCPDDDPRRGGRRVPSSRPTAADVAFAPVVIGAVAGALLSRSWLTGALVGGGVAWLLNRQALPVLTTGEDQVRVRPSSSFIPLEPGSFQIHG